MLAIGLSFALGKSASYPAALIEDLREWSCHDDSSLQWTGCCGGGNILRLECSGSKLPGGNAPNPFLQLIGATDWTNDSGFLGLRWLVSLRLMLQPTFAV